MLDTSELRVEPLWVCWSKRASRSILCSRPVSEALFPVGLSWVYHYREDFLGLPGVLDKGQETWASRTPMHLGWHWGLLTQRPFECFWLPPRVPGSVWVPTKVCGLRRQNKRIGSTWKGWGLLGKPRQAFAAALRGFLATSGRGSPSSDSSSTSLVWRMCLQINVVSHSESPGQ